MVNTTRPGMICTWTSTGRASMPSNATVETRQPLKVPLSSIKMNQVLTIKIDARQKLYEDSIAIKTYCGSCLSGVTVS